MKFMDDDLGEGTEGTICEWAPTAGPRECHAPNGRLSGIGGGSGGPGRSGREVGVWCMATNGLAVICREADPDSPGEGPV